MGVDQSTTQKKNGLSQEVHKLWDHTELPNPDNNSEGHAKDNNEGLAKETPKRPPGGPLEDDNPMVEDDPQSTYGDQVSQVSPSVIYEVQPVVFHWNHGGGEVYLVTSQDDWQAEHKLRKSQSDFSAILELPPGVHWYKFIVDDVWSCARDQPHKQEENGGYVNFVKVTHCSAASLACEEEDTFDVTPGVFGSIYGGFRKKTKETQEEFSQRLPRASSPFMGPGPPPEAPPHLGQILLNENRRSSDPLHTLQDPLSIRKPSHTEIEHLYLAQHVPDEITTMGLTTRYGEKTYTTVYYRPKEPASKSCQGSEASPWKSKVGHMNSDHALRTVIC